MWRLHWGEIEAGKAVRRLRDQARLMESVPLPHSPCVILSLCPPRSLPAHILSPDLSPGRSLGQGCTVSVRNTSSTPLSRKTWASRVLAQSFPLHICKMGITVTACRVVVGPAVKMGTPPKVTGVHIHTEGRLVPARKELNHETNTGSQG